MKTFDDFLRQHHAPGTAKRYAREVSLFFLSIEKKRDANYSEIMQYLGEVRKAKGPGNLRCTLAAIKRYFDYLNETGQRADHPAKSIRLRDQRHRDIQLQDLFSSAELEQILNKKERYKILQNRNQTILMLLIYQGLTTGEIIKLQLSDIDFAQAKVKVQGGRKTNSRTLKLRPKQVLPLYKYVQDDRPKLLKVESNQLIINKSGYPENGEGISYLVSTQKRLFPLRKLNPKTIRQSVIANLLDSGMDLRKVQVFAGHRYPSATERYRQTEVEALKQAILKHHPLS